ncbi:hypothetical protein J4438_02190 [Candidatus Woesearchaeota archaeon]|nr:hypothetical protein [Candidatus Woesearchaeota archaeon]
MNKKAVSPLVATILLVAITIVIAFLVFWWYGDLIGKQLEKSKVDLEKVCVNDLDYSVSSPECTGNDPTKKIVSFFVQNSGSVKIGGFKVDGFGNTGNTFTEEIPYAIFPGINNKVSFEVDTQDVGKNLEFDIVPMVYGGGKTRYCSEKAQKANIVCS